MKGSDIVSTAVSIPATIVLLYIVWKNSHWSVALTLTLLAIGSELKTLTRLLRS